MGENAEPMSSPIRNQVRAVFIPVSDMRRAIAWYSQLLGLPVKETSHEGKIYDLAMTSDIVLILDGHKPVTNSSQPLFFLWTDDIRATYDFLKRSDIEMIG